VRAMTDESSHFARLRTAFFTGLVLLAPLAVTLIVFIWLVSQVGGSFRNLLFAWIPDSWQRFNLLWDLFFTGIVVLLITALGILSRWVIGRYFGGVTERFIQGIPGVGGLYNMVKQIVQTFSGENRAAFSKVVLVEFPHAGSYAIAFLTNNSGGEASARTVEDLVAVFVPTTPNPTGGYLLLLPRAKVVELDMTVRDGMKFVISGGSVLPPWPDAHPVTVANPAAAASLAAPHA
jgi:uncharacterized membrane protein